MIKKLIALLLTVAFLLNSLSLIGQTASAGIPDSGLFNRVKSDILSSQTRYAIIENSVSGEIESICYDSISGAFYEDGSVHITYRAGNGLVLSGRYLEPDLVKNVHASGVTPISAGAGSEGNDIGLDRLRELVEEKSDVVVVAVLDTGTDVSHTWFEGRLFSPYDVIEKDYNPQDMSGHGTHVAGIIAANTPRNVKIMPIRVFGDTGGALDSNIVKGIDYAIKNGADIINLSLGGYGTTSYLEKAIDYAFSKGVMVITSAGNKAKDLSHDYPAAFPEVITVGATGRDGDLLYYSNTGDGLDLCAPGEKIESSVPGNETESKSGTSMAAPLVSSAAAMLLLEDNTRGIDAIEKILKENTRDLGAPGHDPVFGSGELAFSNYKSSQDFYLITSEREKISNEEKFNMNLRVFSGEKISKFDVYIDGQIKHTILTGRKTGQTDLNLDIRSLSAGKHTLEIRPYSITGFNPDPVIKDFDIPQYNLRISIYDIFDRPVHNADIEVLGYTRDGSIEKIKQQSVVQNGVWMANLDFERLSLKYEIIKCYVESYSGAETSEKALYLRLAGKTGQKVFETSECSFLNISSDDSRIMSSCHAVTRIVGERFAGFGSESTWRNDPDVYSIQTGNTRLKMISYEDNEEMVYSGLLFYDIADLWLDIYSYSDSDVKNPDVYPDIWYYKGFISDLDQDVWFSLSESPILTFRAGEEIQEPVIYSLRDVENEKQLFGHISNDSDGMVLTPGSYIFQAEPRRVLEDGREAWDFYTGSLTLDSPGINEYSFGGGLKDVYWYDGKLRRLIHEWVDDYGFSYNVRIEFSPGLSTFRPVIPQLSLTPEAGGESIIIEGTSVQGVNDSNNHGYDLSGVPDGVYKLEFLSEEDLMAFPVKPAADSITIINKEVFYPENTPPLVFTDYISYVNPGSVFIYDLYEEFSDPEQEELYFQATKGWIVDGVFYYRDLTGKDIEIEITANDGRGGYAGFVHNIIITDRMEWEPEYEPIPEIDSIGASSWAVSAIQSSIKEKIVPMELLDLFQTNITREEFSVFIVKMIEKLRGPIKPSPSVSFLDTSDASILKAASLNILTGYNGFFNPYDELSREEMCAILYRAIKFIQPSKTLPVDNAPLFKDSGVVSGWAKEAVDFCSAKGIILGSYGILNPAGSISREQAISMVYRAYLYSR